MKTTLGITPSKSVLQGCPSPSDCTHRYLGVNCVEQELLILILIVPGGEDGAELEEDVGRHGVDPEHEGCEDVESEVAHVDAGTGVES